MRTEYSKPPAVVEDEKSTLLGFILPKTVAGLAVWVLLIGIGIAASGVAFFAFYQYRTAALEQRSTISRNSSTPRQSAGRTSSIN